MSEAEEKATGVIGRGESIITKKHPDADVEAENSDELAKREDSEIEGIKESEGWMFPKVKLSAWDPENEKQWEATGKFIAKRNLLASIPNLTCGFGVWLVWSVIATKIQNMHDQDPDVYRFADWGSPQGKAYRSVLFLLPGVAGLSGGTLRIPNSFLTQVSGGRNVVYSTSLLLCIPMLIAGIALSDPNCSFNTLLAAALLSGVGGGAFASSMSNISFYYPKRLQGMALGYNGGIGNLGVSISQLLAPIFMSSSFGASTIAPSGIAGWPDNAGWLWFPLCAFSAILAFFFMSNQPHHGEANNLHSLFNFYWMECVGFVASFIGVITLVMTRSSGLVQSPGGQVAHKFLLVALAMFCEHLFMMASPKKARDRVIKQAVIFKRKHNYIMTWLYIMCFGSFIGYSGSFPKLIVDLFGYLQGDGCVVDRVFTLGTTEEECETLGGVYEIGYDYPNPNAPKGSRVAWLGAFVGSLARPVGGVMADKYGGAKMTMIAIVWCTIAAFAQGALVQKAQGMADPNKLYGWFIFLFLNLFLCTGFMNGTTFRTIGVLFPPEEAGTVLGWSSAVASYGAFIIPTMFGIALQAGAPQVTFYGLGGYYVTCGLLNFWYYLRPGCEKPGV
jgi:NNP family nitrate/nitrite transporter-like MFS transporter|eukprot:CAMPEP_0197278582 /NCGR_PEP_ID=MMETSP1432-20130617/18885_1 /TAXON_ID=44447 /ORGANISM="Pseudo-nitzschia delicatissima, Strain UNC1205" /LENGTH=615 /DNA_ID=CAMNT_0042744995 /DNA_START=20 /DNA_END=1867 /DNA_ORIENTATION=+